MLCNWCGSTVKDGQDCCKECGTKIVLKYVTPLGDIMKKCCAACGAEVGSETFCKRCGAVAATGKMPAAPARPVSATPGRRPAARPVPKKSSNFVLLSVIVGVVFLVGVAAMLNILKPKDSAVSVGSDGVAVEETKLECDVSILDCNSLSKLEEAGTKITVTNEQEALQLLTEVSEQVFDVSDINKYLKPESVNKVGDTTYYRFQQIYRKDDTEHNVYGKGVVVAADKNGNVFYLGGNFVPIEELEKKFVPKNTEENKKINIDAKNTGAPWVEINNDGADLPSDDANNQLNEEGNMEAYVAAAESFFNECAGVVGVNGATQSGQMPWQIEHEVSNDGTFCEPAKSKISIHTDFANTDAVVRAYSHLVIHKNAKICPEDVGEGGEISRAYADIFTEMIEGKLKDAEPDWITYDGTKFVVDQSEDPNNISPRRKLLEVSYKLVKGDSPILSKEKAAQLWYRSLYLLTPDSDVSDCRAAVVATAKSMELNSDVIGSFFDAVGIQNPNIKPFKTTYGEADIKDLENEVSGQQK